MEDTPEVLFHGLLAHLEDDGDVAVALALGDPEEDFGFTASEAEVALQRAGAAEIGAEGGVGGGILHPGFDGFGAGEAGLDRREEIFADDGFGEVVIGAEVHADPLIGAVAAGGEENERQQRGGRLGPQGLDDAIAIQLRHHDIADDEIGFLRAGFFEAYAAVLRRVHFITFELQHERDIPAHRSLIFDDENTMLGVHVRGLWQISRAGAIQLKSESAGRGKTLCGANMAPATIHQLRKSFERIEAQGHVAALVFYQRLFALDPRLRALFRDDIEAQAHKLMEMLSTALGMLERPKELQAELEELGARHVGYGAQPHHYATVGTALFDMLERILGLDFTPELRIHWTALYRLITEAMQRGAQTAHAQLR